MKETKRFSLRKQKLLYYHKVFIFFVIKHVENNIYVHSFNLEIKIINLLQQFLSLSFEFISRCLENLWYKCNAFRQINIEQNN